jgi:peptidoglycan/LPS O-acetylase OafA/YrhL
MTGLVISGLEKGNFSILSFYMARSRRILPALLVLCAVLLILGWWLMPAADYKALSALSASSVTFLSNIKFWLEAGYFDNASHDKWLLHTWSLAVEWQFYLILPVVLSIIWKVLPGRKVASWAIVFGFLVSFALCVALTPTKPTGSFFMLPTRAWEMLAGGLVYLFASGLTINVWRRRALEAIGLVTIAVSIGIFEASSAWPGWRAGLPVVGTMLVLFAARDKSLMTGNVLVQWLGTRSYSLYLWHWPITVALRYLDVFTQPVAVLMGLVITCLLGDASYRLVETHSGEYLRKLPQLRGFGLVLSCVALVAGLSGVVYSNNGFIDRFGQEIEIVSREQFNKNTLYIRCMPSAGAESPSCMYGGDKLKVILIGDSHANAVVTALSKALPLSFGVMEWTYAACPFLIGAHGTNFQVKNKCSEFVDWVTTQLKSIPEDIPVVILNRYAQYALGQNEDESQKNIP